ncbi:M28 family peptidase [Aureibaculum marinum]|uniref:M28 family peptidase n=1 Tax=Aureibaculum marinum TaxID=2487930 RepID=A0A3N4NJV3_9FLAO|nr:M28 family peptidase [Aureibaculum marinum]RPD91799.1 M28 family peptidase [Aureibaculum marinum]
MIRNLIFGIIFLSFGMGFSQNTKTDVSEYLSLVRDEFTGNQAYKTTVFVEQFWRVVGNEGFNKSIYHIATTLENSGYVLESNAKETDRFTYRIEKRPLKNPTWQPIDARLTIVGEDMPLLESSTNRNMTYLNSASTPKGGVVAEVVYIKDLELLEKIDIKGKVVFAEMSPYRLYKTALKNGALGMLTYNMPAYLQPEKNSTSIQFRSIPYNEKNIWGMALSYQAKERLIKALERGKVKVKAVVNTKIYPSEELTIVADIKGNVTPEERLVFSAHVQEPGANDNASGVGVQLEMAQLAAKFVKDKKIPLDRTLTFLWGDEIISTQRYIKEDSLRASTIKWGISLDMVGENTALTGGSFLIEKMPDPSAIWTRGNDKHSEWGGRPLTLEDMKPHYLNDFIVSVFEKQGKFANWVVNTNPFEGGSDHTPFLKADIPGLLLWHFTDQFYHTDNDRIDKVSKETLKNVGTAALASAFTLLNANTKTALKELRNIKTKAEIRLKNEFLLSQKSIAEGNDFLEEIKILSAWNTWYQKSFESLKDMSNTPNTKLNRAIKKAKMQLDKQTENYIKLLK